MVNTDIFLGSGASLTLVPETDFRIEPDATPAENDTTVTLDTTNFGHFKLVTDLYVGCTLKLYNASDVLQTTHRVTENTNTTLTFTPKITNSGTLTNFYYVLQAYGSPLPAPEVAGGTGYVDEVTTVTFLSDTKTDYDGIYQVFTILPSDGGTATTRGIWYDDSAGDSAPSTGAVADTEVPIDNAGINTKEEIAALFTTYINTVSNISATRNGNVVTVTNEFGGNNSAATTTSAAGIVSVSQTTAGATTTGTAAKRLLADNWLGLIETGTFPNVETELKRLNLALGGSRNWTHQYKGMETASGGNLAFVATHPAWVYYFLGNCDSVSTSALTVGANTGVSNAHTASVSDGVFIDNGGHLKQGPIFYRSVGTKMTPPLMTGDASGAMDSVTLPSSAANVISYTFKESDGEDLPSFSLEQTITKNASTDTYKTGTDVKEDNAFVRIARGNRVNTLTMTANENEEVKMTLDLNTRTVSQPPTDAVYEARNGKGTNTDLFNYNTAQESYNEPYFFSGGSLNIFGQEFSKVTNFTLTMNNNLQDKRYIGVGNRSIKEGIPAQREYEISLTTMITDNSLFNELLNKTDTAEASNSNIVLTFTKQGNSNETFTMTFSDYLLESANVTVPEDKGAVTMEAVIKPRTCVSVTAQTNWVLMG